MSIIRLTPAINSTEARELWTLQNQIGSIISRLECGDDCLLHQITKKSQATKSGRKDIMDDILLDAFLQRKTAFKTNLHY